MYFNIKFGSNHFFIFATRPTPQLSFSRLESYKLSFLIGKFSNELIARLESEEIGRIHLQALIGFLTLEKCLAEMWDNKLNLNMIRKSFPRFQLNKKLFTVFQVLLRIIYSIINCQPLEPIKIKTKLF